MSIRLPRPITCVLQSVTIGSALLILGVFDQDLAFARNRHGVYRLDIDLSSNRPVIRGVFGRFPSVSVSPNCNQASKSFLPSARELVTEIPSRVASPAPPFGHGCGVTQCRYGQMPTAPCCFSPSMPVPTSNCALICTNWSCMAGRAPGCCGQCMWVQGQCTGCLDEDVGCKGTCTGSQPQQR